MHPMLAVMFVVGLIVLLFALVLRLLGGHKADTNPQDDDDPRLSPQAAYNIVYLIFLRGGALLLLASGILYYVLT